MEASCGEAPWPCAGPNAAPAQNRPAKIVPAAARLLTLLIGENADMDGLLIYVRVLIFSLPRSRKSTSHAARNAASASKSSANQAPSTHDPGQRCNGTGIKR